MIQALKEDSSITHWDAKRWFLEGVKDYIQRGFKLDIPDICRKTVEDARYDLDTVQKWIDDYCEVAAHCFFHNENMKDLDKIDLDLETTGTRSPYFAQALELVLSFIS